MISIGLAGWGDHDELYRAGVKAKDKLKEYARQFPIVEADSPFYAIHSEHTYAQWAEQTPQEFAFIVKAYQGMTGHLRGPTIFENEASMFTAFCDSIRPLSEAGKLKAVLFQYPPWFDCKRENVKKIRRARERMGDVPLALEFRHQSWFTPEMKPKTLDFMESAGWAHSICDEPQAGPGSVPTVLVPTSSRLTIVRMHGRNAAGWNKNRTFGPSFDAGSQNGEEKSWREVRYLYDYSTMELAEWKSNLEQLQALDAQDICVIFNNNSGGHAAGNAKALMAMLGIEPPSATDWPDAEQLQLFDGF